MKKNYLFLLLLLIPGFAFSNEGTITLDVNTAVEYAIKTNISIQEEEIDLKQAERKYKHSWNNLLPSVSGKAIVNGGGSLTDSSTSQVSFETGLSANLNVNAGIKDKIESLKLTYENGKISYKNAINQLEYEVTSAFYSLLVLENQVSLNKESLQAYKNQYEQTKSKKEKGLASELDLLTAQVNYESAKINLRDAEKSYKNNLNDFLNNIGIKSEENAEVKLLGTLDDCFSLIQTIDTNQDIDQLVEKNASVTSLQASLNQTQLSRKQLYNSSFLPSLNLSANVNPYSYSKSNSVGTQISSGGQSSSSTQGSTGSQGAKSWSVSAGLSFSLDNYLPGSSARDSISDLEDSIEKLKLEIEETKSKLKIQLKQMLDEIEFGKEALENCRLNVELAKKSFQMAEVAYKNGTKDLLSLQNIQSTYSNAQAQYMNQQLSLINTVLNYKKLISE